MACVRQSVPCLVTYSSDLTDEEVGNAKQLIGWTFWFGPAFFALVSFAGMIFALTGEALALWIATPIFVASIVFWTARLRQCKDFDCDMERRIVEVLDGAPEKVWLTRSGDCYISLQGRTIKVPNDSYGALKEATIVKVVFLPTSGIAVHVDAGRGIGLS
jgi:hypothetical protein